MNTVGIVDYGMCNLHSVARAVEECGARPVVADNARDICAVARIILPGVGAFPLAMQNIKARGLDEALREQVIENCIPFLGICLGMQLLATVGLEHETCDGLGWIAGETRRLETNDEDRRLPHVGWNEVQIVHESPLFRGIPSGRDFYFVHSYALFPNSHEDVLARTPYGMGFVSAVERGHVFGVQFHPEKSQRVGFELLRNFLAV